MKLKNFIGHFRTITRHRHKVIAHCRKAGIFWQGLRHDLSKYSPSEFLLGVKYYQGTRSPNEGERDVYGYSLAWMHHKGRNKHHLEYWIDYAPELGYRMGGMEMPVRYVVEMFCDRVAACQTYQKGNYTDASPWDYYAGSADHYIIHPKTRALLEQLLRMLRDEGEARTLDYIRREVLKNR